MGAIVLDFNTGEQLEQIITKEPKDVFDKLALRFNTTRDKVLLKPKLRMSKNNTLKLDMYKGNVHEPWEKQAKNFKGANKAMPLPYDLEYIKAYIEKKQPETIVIGNKYDSFMWMDKKYKTTLNLLKFLEVPMNVKKVIINTKSDLIAINEYCRVLKKLTNVGIKIEINFINKDKCCQQEKIDSPGAPSPLRRRKALAKLRMHGIVNHY